ncbi:hypothetical protein CEXT_154051, partial [Caerostris extrusa]
MTAIANPLGHNVKNAICNVAETWKFWFLKQKVRLDFSKLHQVNYLVV